MEDDLDEKLKGDCNSTFRKVLCELSEEQHQQLVDNLKEAQTNAKADVNMAGVISFSQNFNQASCHMIRKRKR